MHMSDEQYLLFSEIIGDSMKLQAVHSLRDRTEPQFGIWKTTTLILLTQIRDKINIILEKETQRKKEYMFGGRSNGQDSSL